LDTARLGRGEIIAAVSAVILLLVMFIFDWFSIDLGDDPLIGAAVAGADTGANAWVAFSFIDIVLFVTILVAIGFAVMAANAQSHNLPVAGSALVAAFGILSVLLILFRIISPPGAGDIPDGLDISVARDIGVFLGLLAAGGIAYGGYLGMQEEGTSFSAQADNLQNRDTTPPPPSRGGGTPPPPPPPSNQPPAV